MITEREFVESLKIKVIQRNKITEQYAGENILNMRAVLCADTVTEHGPRDMYFTNGDIRDCGFNPEKIYDTVLFESMVEKELCIVEGAETAKQRIREEYSEQVEKIKPSNLYCLWYQDGRQAATILLDGYVLELLAHQLNTDLILLIGKTRAYVIPALPMPMSDESIEALEKSLATMNEREGETITDKALYYNQSTRLINIISTGR